ncbi:MAG: hypothetical protein AAFX99_05005 [Myxococcota bacterium]
MKHTWPWYGLYLITMMMSVGCGGDSGSTTTACTDPAGCEDTGITSGDTTSDSEVLADTDEADTEASEDTDSPPEDTDDPLGDTDPPPGDTDNPTEDTDDLPGDTTPDLPDGDPPPEGETLVRLTVVNDRDVIRQGELARSGVALPAALELRNLDGLVVVDSDGQAVPAQFRALARWGGDPEDSSLPLMWVEVAAQLDRMEGNTTRLLHLIRAPAQTVPDALTLEGDVVDTGAARFTLDRSSTQLLRRVELANGATPIAATGGGPQLMLDDGTVLDADDITGLTFEILEQGPVRLVVRQRGHFDSAATACPSGVGYASLDYDLEMAFTRGSDDIELRFTIRNTCGDGFGGPWTDQTRLIDAWSFVLPLADAQPQEVAWSTQGPLTVMEGNTLEVAQARGGGQPWARRAEVVVDGNVQTRAEQFTQPMAAALGTNWAVGGQLAFMRTREPQALRIEDNALVVAVISERLPMGEAVGIWNHAAIRFASDASALEAEVGPTTALLERGLLVHAHHDDLNAAQVFLPLRASGTNVADTVYSAILPQLHNGTVAEGGQWDRARCYGSQLWPDTVTDRWVVDFDTPYDHPAVMNYWNPLGAELYEHLRTGDPEWAWTMALPAAWLQAHSAYYNVGEQTHSNRNGFAVTSGGGGEGQWHRSNQGSDDYTYSAGLKLAYLVRPEQALLDRFRQAGQTAVNRYNIPQERQDTREPFVNALPISRQVIQHLELLFNCAQFVPGDAGNACRNRLHTVVAEMAADNLAPGVMCQSDIPENPCSTPQQFMQAALMFEFFVRYTLTYPGRIPDLRDALVRIGHNYARYGLPRRSDMSIDPGQDFSAGMRCQLSDDRTETIRCEAIPNSDARTVTWPANRAHTLAVLFMADQLDPNRMLCTDLVQAFNDPGLEGPMRDWAGDTGYWKGANQSLQNLIFAIGAEGTCP